MIKTSVANYIGAPIRKTNQKALQADGVTPLSIAGETHLMLSRNSVRVLTRILKIGIKMLSSRKSWRFPLLFN